MRDELITKWKNSLVLNDEKELFEDIETKVHTEKTSEKLEEVVENLSRDNDVFAEILVEEKAIVDDTVTADDNIVFEEVPIVEDDAFKEPVIEVVDEKVRHEVKDEIETLEPIEENNLEVEKELLRMERKKFEIEKSLAYERLQLEIEMLKQEREKFDRVRRQYDKQRRLNEESFQEAKMEFEKYKELEMQKLQLETKEMLNNCHNFKNFFDSYNGDKK